MGVTFDPEVLVDYPEVFSYVKKYGNFTMAYSVLQEGMKYYYNNDGIFAWMPCGPFAFVLGDPLISLESQSEIIRNFVKHCKHNRIWPAVVQCGLHTAKTLVEEGFCAEPLGLEYITGIKEFSLKGKERYHLRRWYSHASKSGVVVQEVPCDDKEMWSHLKNISEVWIEMKNRNRRNRLKELRFLTRPFMGQPEEDTRCFVAICRQRPVAFIVFDPVYDNERIVGYYSNIERYLPEVPNGTPDLIRMRAMDKFREEDISILSLGLSPLHPMDIKLPISPSFKYRWISYLFYNYGERLYPFKGNAFHKEKWEEDVRPVFFCFEPMRTFPAIWEMLKVIGIK